MSDRKNNNLRLVKSDPEDTEERDRRRRRATRIVIIVAVIAAAAVAAYLLLARFWTYSDYRVTKETDRSDTSATHYLAYGNGYVKYSNDGASYVTVGNDTEWNQSYEMENPMVSVCGSYIAFADRQGETVYILNAEGLQGEFSVNRPISRIDVASQGAVAVMTMDSGTGYLSLYDKTGGQIAEGAIYVENTGTPMDIALSDDGKNLAVSILDVSSGTARTTINFYNFDTAGQNQIDNMVGAFQYADTIIPELAYVGNDTLLAFADSGALVFEGAGSPKETARVETEDEIQGIFYDDSYFGLVYSSASQEAGRSIRVYDTSCRERSLIETDFSYDSIGFLGNHEICLYSTQRCDIYTLSGSLKFSDEFEDEFMGIFHWRGYRSYVFLMEGETERVRLRLFGNLFGNGAEDTDAVLGVVGAEYTEDAEYAEDTDDSENPEYTENIEGEEAAE